jgi:hypothetical protein
MIAASSADLQAPARLPDEIAAMPASAKICPGSPTTSP